MICLLNLIGFNSSIYPISPDGDLGELKEIWFVYVINLSFFKFLNYGK